MRSIKTLTDRCKSSAFIAKEVRLITGHSRRNNLHPCEINSMFVQVSILKRVLGVKEIIAGIKRSVVSKLKPHFAICDLDIACDALATLKTFVMQNFLSPQQISEASCETRRISCMARIIELLCKLHEHGSKISPGNQSKIDRAALKIQQSGREGEKMTEENETALLKLIKEFSEEYSVSGLSEQERLMVVKAVGLKKGHWFKCPEGHYYCIGECGGAMQKAKCMECGAVIGGERHTLTSGNLHAPEMDGSRFAAWSEAANLNNYRF